MILSDQEVQFFVNTIKNTSGYDFSEYSEKSLKRRLQKILIDNNSDLVTLINKLKTNKEFLEQTVKDITVNTTELFRDPQIWQTLR